MQRMWCCLLESYTATDIWQSYTATDIWICSLKKFRWNWTGHTRNTSTHADVHWRARTHTHTHTHTRPRASKQATLKQAPNNKCTQANEIHYIFRLMHSCPSSFAVVLFCLFVSLFFVLVCLFVFSHHSVVNHCQPLCVQCTDIHLASMVKVPKRKQFKKTIVSD